MKTRISAPAHPSATGGLVFGQRPRRGRSPVEHRGTFVRHSVRSSVRPPQALSGLKSALSGLKFTLSGLKSALSGLESVLSGLKSALLGRTDGQNDERKSPCVLQEFVPFGAAALLPLTPYHNHAKQGNGYR